MQINTEQPPKHEKSGPSKKTPEKIYSPEKLKKQAEQLYQLAKQRYDIMKELKYNEDVNYLFSRAETLLNQTKKGGLSQNFMREIEEGLQDLAKQIELYRSTGKLYNKNINRSQFRLDLEKDSLHEYDDTVMSTDSDSNGLSEEQLDDSTIPHIPALRKPKQAAEAHDDEKQVEIIMKRIADLQKEVRALKQQFTNIYITNDLPAGVKIDLDMLETKLITASNALSRKEIQYLADQLIEAEQEISRLKENLKPKLKIAITNLK